MNIQSFKTKTGKFEVNNYGNGWAYEVIDTATGANFWLQDDDASLLRSETKGFKSEDIIEEYMINLTGELHTEMVNYPRF